MIEDESVESHCGDKQHLWQSLKASQAKIKSLEKQLEEAKEEIAWGKRQYQYKNEAYDSGLRMYKRELSLQARLKMAVKALEKIVEGHPADSEGPTIIIRWSQEIAKQTLKQIGETHEKPA